MASLLCTVALWYVQYLPEARLSMIRVAQMLEGTTEVIALPNPFQPLISSGIGLAMSTHITSGDSTTVGTSETSYKECTPIMKK
ncbi:hypothetical protein GIB67_001754 [Kingdonia uniflora]|uniref:Uncharacterized protein n=1 Tax=Kingdonia uniflora TaxID=39325 RepID=A0A7J7LBM0_9MAGN|nr:hypothetical protein GIB67_001754 [Kingdonia uniflora]